MKLLTLILLLAFVAPAFAQDWEVWSGRAINLATGQSYPASGNGPLKSAVLHSKPGDVIAVMNRVPFHLAIGSGENYRKHEMVRADPVIVTIVGGSPTAEIGPLSWSGKKAPGGAPGFAVESLTVMDLIVDGRASQSPLVGVYKNKYGDIRFERVTLRSSRTTTKWGSRIMGHARTITFVGCLFLDGGIEHPWYFDNPSDSVLMDGNIAEGWGRTFCQVVTREYPVAGWKNPGAATGSCIFRNNTSINNGWEGGNGGTAFTVAGWPNGKVVIQNNYATSPWENGGIMLWGDRSKMGDLIRPDGFVFGKVVIRENILDFPNGIRSNIAVQGAALLEVRVGELRSMSVASANRGIDIAHNGFECGVVEFHSRVDPNLWDVAARQRFLKHKKVIDPHDYWTSAPDSGE